MKHRKTQYMFIGFFWLSLFNYTTALFYNSDAKYQLTAPWYLFVIRDAIYIALLAFFIYKFRFFSIRKTMGPAYSKFIKWFSILISIYLVIVLTHLFHRDPKGIMQHDMRNIALYSFFLPFLPVIFERSEDLELLIKNVLYGGIVMSVLGLITFYIEPFRGTWEGRAFATMNTPNILAAFLALCMFIVVGRWERLGHRKSLSFLSVYLISFVMTNSLTVFFLINFGLFFLFIFKFGLWRGVLCSCFAFFMMVFLSISLKVADNFDHYGIKGSILECDSPSRYLVDKLDNITSGKFRSVVLPGTNVKKEYELIRGYAMRRSQLIALATGEIFADTSYKGANLKYISCLLFGDFSSHRYKKFDSQYANLMANSGIIGVLIFLFIFGWGTWEGIWLWFKSKVSLALPFSIFILSMVIVGFNGIAFLNRFPINFFLYLSLGIIFLEKDRVIKAADEAAKA